MNQVKPDHLKVERSCSREFSIYRYQIILPADLETVARVEKYARFCSLERICEISDLPVQRRFVKIVAFENFEPMRPQSHTDIDGIITRIDKLRRVLVG